jgi:hypothetical protein
MLGPEYTRTDSRLGSTATVGPVGVPVTVGIDPVGCCARTLALPGCCAAMTNARNRKRTTASALWSVIFGDNGDKMWPQRRPTKDAARMRTPVRAAARIAAPAGKLPTGPVASEKVGRTKGGGGVNVASRVAVGSVRKAATRVGSKVDVARGTGVGGGSISRIAPVTVTLAA